MKNLNKHDIAILNKIRHTDMWGFDVSYDIKNKYVIVYRQTQHPDRPILTEDYCSILSDEQGVVTLFTMNTWTGEKIISDTTALIEFDKWLIASK